MQTFSISLTKHLVKRYNMNMSDAMDIIEDEWDFIEEVYASQESTVEALAQDLIDIYMVA
ncbi:hypothetical protein KKG72_05860 [bacterium]|nr:hypothetical protein [bacterium]MBU1993627.1 hypothetical protein [bacterium]